MTPSKALAATLLTSSSFSFSCLSVSLALLSFLRPPASRLLSLLQQPSLLAFSVGGSCLRKATEQKKKEGKFLRPREMEREKEKGLPPFLPTIQMCCWKGGGGACLKTRLVASLLSAETVRVWMDTSWNDRGKKTQRDGSVPLSSPSPCFPSPEGQKVDLPYIFLPFLTNASVVPSTHGSRSPLSSRPQYLLLLPPSPPPPPPPPPPQMP